MLFANSIGSYLGSLCKAAQVGAVPKDCALNFHAIRRQSVAGASAT